MYVCMYVDVDVDVSWYLSASSMTTMVTLLSEMSRPACMQRMSIMRPESWFSSVGWVCAYQR